MKETACIQCCLGGKLPGELAEADQVFLTP